MLRGNWLGLHYFNNRWTDYPRHIVWHLLSQTHLWSFVYSNQLNSTTEVAKPIVLLTHRELRLNKWITSRVIKVQLLWVKTIYFCLSTSVWLGSTPKMLQLNFSILSMLRMEVGFADPVQTFPPQMFHKSKDFLLLILTFEKQEPENIWHFCLINSLMIKNCCQFSVYFFSELKYKYWVNTLINTLYNLIFIKGLQTLLLCTSGWWIPDHVLHDDKVRRIAR